MDVIKINYTNEVFSDSDYIEVPSNINLKIGNLLIVSINSLLHIASVIDFCDNEKDREFKTKFVRVATKKDINQNRRNVIDSSEVLVYAEEKASELELPMHFISSFYTFDRKQLFISYVADNRIDFRELAKVLAQRYKTRIELRQIGVRDRAKKVGGLGPCGLFLCCSTFLTDFVSVSINMAKNQFLALNPTKINGVCGRLLCCLAYEDDNYTYYKKDLPTVGEEYLYKDKPYKVVEVDILNRKIKIENPERNILEEVFIDYGSFE